MFGNKVGHLGRVGSLTLAQRVSAMFSRGEPGAWYDPSDLSTLFQDEAGTTPVTAVEQPVGRILDKSGRGNHATQATTTKRPVYSRRVNLLTKTEQFDDAVWVPTNITPTLGQVGISGVAPVAVRLTPTTANGTHGFKAFFVSGRNGTTHSAYLKADGYSKVGFKESNTSGWFAAFDLSTAAVLSSTPGALPTIQALAGGWCRISFSPVTVNAGQAFDIRVLSPAYTSGDTNASTFVGDGVSGVLMCGPQMEDGLTATPYQRVNTATDYDADPAKFPAYRRLDGVDDSHASATGGGGTAGFFFSASVTPQGGAGTARTLFSDAGTNTGYIVRLNTSNQLELAAGNGTAYTTIATSGTLAVNTTDVVQAWDDGTNLNVKIGNGATASIARPAVSAGTAGYTMGQDNGASTGYFNGRIYSTIYRKDSGLTQVQRESVALYQRQKARMP